MLSELTIMDIEEKENWPDFFPADMVLPPENSQDAAGLVYRLVHTIPPSEKCFWTTHQEQPKRHEKCVTVEEKESVYGTSVWSSKELLIDALESLPQGLKKRVLASGKLEAGMGKMRKTLEEGHLTLWLRKDCKIHLSFGEAK